MSHKNKIGLFGFGTVGKGFYELLEKMPRLNAEITKVCVKRLDLERINHPLYFTDQADELLNDPELSIIVEVISDAQAAKSIVRTALDKGKAVISANKKMIGESLNEIDEWHKSYSKPFLYEAAVGGGIPIVYPMDSLFRDQNVSKIRGILNGSSNYILTQMQRNGWAFDEALEEAQVQGFAEANPSLDVDGHDASYKLGILGYHGFGEVAAFKSCELQSIRNVTEADIKAAKSRQRKIKSIATIEQTEGVYRCSVQPQEIDHTDELFNVDFENNAISVYTEVSGVHMAVGKGAGAYPTGSAVLADLKRILKGSRYEVKATQERSTVAA